MPESANDVLIRIYSQFQGKGHQQAVQANEKLQKSTRQTKHDLLFLGLGTLFFGMQLRRTFGGILSSGMTTFRGITEATYGVQTALTGLNAAGAMLMFTVGDALNAVLEPLMPTILGLVDALVEFMQQHPETVWILIGLALAGIAMQAFGTVVAFISSLMGVMTAATATHTASVATSMAAINSMSFLGAITFLGALAAAALVVKVFVDEMVRWAEKMSGFDENVRNINALVTAQARSKGLEPVKIPMSQISMGGPTGPGAGGGTQAYYNPRAGTYEQQKAAVEKYAGGGGVNINVDARGALFPDSAGAAKLAKMIGNTWMANKVTRMVSSKKR